MKIINKNIDHGVAFDWGQASSDYAKYRDIYPPEFYEKIISLGLCTDGQSVLDIGTGTGVLPRNMYKYGAHFTGADISDNQIAYAKILSEQSGMDIDYIVNSAENLSFPEKSFDTVTACQCFMYFDKGVLLPKIHRWLKDNGHFCILFMAWLPDESKIAQKSEELVLKYNPAWSGGHMKRYELKTPEWLSGLFTVENAVTYDINVQFTRDTWHGRMLSCRGIGASSLTGEEIAEFEKEHKAFLATCPEKFDILHYATILNLRKI